MGDVWVVILLLSLWTEMWQLRVLDVILSALVVRVQLLLVHPAISTSALMS